MCEPTTLLVLSTVVQAAASFEEGRQAKASADFNARTMENDAVRVRNQATEQENDHRRAVAEMISEQRAQFAASGVEIGSGSPLDIISDTGTLGNIDALRIRRSGDDKVKSLTDQARLTRREGKAAYTAGALKAGASLLAGAYQVSDKWYTPKSAAAAPNKFTVNTSGGQIDAFAGHA